MNIGSILKFIKRLGKVVVSGLFFIIPYLKALFLLVAPVVIVYITLVYAFIDLKPLQDNLWPIPAVLDEVRKNMTPRVSSNQNSEPVIIIIDAFERAPLVPEIYLFVSFLISLYMFWYWRKYDLVRKNFQQIKQKANDGNNDINSRDCHVIQELKERAVSLRMRADLSLIGAFVLSMAGVYFIIFILPSVQEVERSTQEARFKEIISDTLQPIVDGQYWLKIPENISEDEIIAIRDSFKVRGNISVRAFEQFSRFVTKNGGESWNESDSFKMESGERVRMANFSANGNIGLVAGNLGSIFLTRNGGESWNEPDDMVFKSLEWVDAVKFNTDGSIGLVAGDEGSVFLTRNGGVSWDKPDNLKLESGERVTEAAFSKDKNVGLVAGNLGSVYFTRNGGESWNEPNDLALKSGEWVIAAIFSSDGSIGLVAGDEGSVYLTRNGGESWNKPDDLALKSRELISTAIFSEDGNISLFAGDGGSVYLSRNGGKSWNDPDDLALKSGESVSTAIFSSDGSIGQVVGDQGSIYLTKNGGESWNKSNDLALKSGESVSTANFSEDGNIGMLAGNEGSIFLTRNWGEDWTQPDTLILKPSEQVLATTFSTDRITGSALTNRYLVSVTKDGGNNWIQAEEITLKPRENVIGGVFSADGNIGLVAGDEGSVFLTRDGGEDWKHPDNLKLEPGEQVSAANFSSDGNIGMVAGNKGSVFLTRDGGENWNRSDELRLKPQEWITKIIFSMDGSTGVAAGDEGSIYRTRDKGSNWMLTKGESIDGNNPIISVGLLSASKMSGAIVDAESDSVLENEFYVAEARNNLFYLLKVYPELEKWRSMSLVELRNEMKQDEILRRSDIFGTITERVAEKVGDSGNRRNGQGSYSSVVEDLTIKRIVSLTILFLLLHILVRYSQYCMRLAAFWESRSDAALLSGSFAEAKTERFDNLVIALAPDAYDFKSHHKSPFSRLFEKKS